MVNSAVLRRAAVALLLSAADESLGAQQPGVTALPDSMVTRIDGIFAPLGGRGAPGCGVGVSRAGEPVLTRAYGLANLEYGVPNTPETIFESGSVAKQFTAAAVVLLARDGRLSLDDDVRQYVPEVPSFGKKISIRNLLTHTSGLRDQWGLLGLQGRGAGTQVHSFATILDLVAHQTTLNFEPGAEYLYSNTGYVLAAIIVQRVSGMPFARFTDERLFRPLGMTSTRWRDDHTAVVKGRATAYRGTASAGFHTDMPFTNVHGNGGLLTTVGDMLKWNTMLDAPPASFGGAAFAQLMERSMVLASGRRITYALGLDVSSKDGVQEVTHGGSTAGYRTWLARYPDQQVSVAVFCNVATANPTALGNQVAALFVKRQRAGALGDASSSAADPRLSDEQLRRYAGVFRVGRTQDVLRVAVRDGTLVTELPSARVLTSVGADRFTVPGQGELTYRLRGGNVRDVLFVGTDGDTLVFEPAVAAAVTATDLAGYTGSYWSDEIETRLTVAVRGDSLVLRRRPVDEIVLHPTVRDGFMGQQIGTVVFSRDAGGNVDGFSVFAGRVRGLRFVRSK